ncbi:CaiB/BaiF CoA transferase family protein [Actinoplanes flavus]|uniref:CaiB/BaiF CoA transferase family protein n=1 Tax=Actinoplanes flavus TaxID=2820290 RepID=UPI001EE59A31|nr:CoA transferase [Actinoplanes flavus]
MRPLEDIRIVAVEQYGAGPFGSVHLADLGADVIKIEEPGTGGDVGRYVPPYQHGEDSLFFETFNRGKRSLSLDLASPAGREVFEDLVRHSDAVYSNLRGDVPAKIGITYDQLRHINPSIVCCSLTGFGMTGPRAAQPGYDYILQGLAGWMDLTGEPGGPPTKSGLSIVDYSGGYVAAIALLAGVHAARRDGHGMDCDLSLFDTAVGMLTYPATWHLNAGFEPARTRHSAHPSLVPFQLFPSADGWVVVGCAKEKFWHRLVAVLETLPPSNALASNAFASNAAIQGAPGSSVAAQGGAGSSVAAQGGAGLSVAAQGGAGSSVAAQGGAGLSVAAQGGAGLSVAAQGGAGLNAPSQGAAGSSVAAQGGAGLSAAAQGGAGLNAAAQGAAGPSAAARGAVGPGAAAGGEGGTALSDPRFATFADRRMHAEVLLPLLENIFATRTTAEWLALLEPAGIPCGPVNDVAAALRDPHTLARGLVVETEHPHYGTVRQVASPVRVGDAPPAYRRAPRRGEDLGYVAELLGYSDTRLTELRSSGAFGKDPE